MTSPADAGSEKRASCVLFFWVKITVFAAHLSVSVTGYSYILRGCHAFAVRAFLRVSQL